MNLKMNYNWIQSLWGCKKSFSLDIVLGKDVNGCNEVYCSSYNTSLYQTIYNSNNRISLER